jgi:hypothetical protein
MSQSPCHSRHFLTGLLRRKFRLPAGYTHTWSGEYEFEVRAKDQLKVILPVVFFVIFVLLYLIFHSATEAMVLILPTFYAKTGDLILQRLLGYNLNVGFGWAMSRYFGIAVDTGVVMVLYLHEALDLGASAHQGGDRGSSNGGSAATPPPKADYRHGSAGQPHSNSVGERHWFRRDEADCRSDCGRNDYRNNSRTDSGASVLLSL